MNIYLQYFHDICIKVFIVLLTFIYKFPIIWYYFIISYDIALCDTIITV